MKNLWSRLISFILYGTCLVLGFRLGIAGVFYIYPRIAPTISAAILKAPILILVVYAILIGLSVSLAVYLIKESNVLQPLLLSRPLLRNLLVWLLAGLSFGFAYWAFLQVFAMSILIMKKVL